LVEKELNFGKENEFKRQGRIRGVCNLPEQIPKFVRVRNLL